MQEKLERLIELYSDIRKLQGEYDTIRGEIEEKMSDNDVFMVGDTKVSKIVKRTTVLKEGVTIEDIKNQFPFAIETKETVNMKELEKDEDAFDLLALTETRYVQVNLPKNAK